MQMLLEYGDFRDVGGDVVREVGQVQVCLIIYLMNNFLVFIMFQGVCQGLGYSNK